jgi:hypothetical protein
MPYNPNSGYGAAVLYAVHSKVPTFGRVFVVVDPDDYDEETYQRMEEVFRSDPDGKLRYFTDLATAYAATESNNNDCIVLDGNSTHLLTSMLDVSNNRVHFFGMDWLLGNKRRYGQGSKIQSTITTGATNIATIKITGARCSFHGIKFDAANTVDEGVYCVADGGEYTYFEDCEIYKSSDLDVTGAAELLCNGDGSTYKNCYIGSTVNAISGAILRPCVLMTRETITGKVARDVTFEGCIFARKCGNTGNRFIYGANATDVERMCLIKDCIFFNTKLATATPAQNIAFGSSLTEGYVLLKDCTSIGAATAMSTTTGVFTADTTPDATGAAAGIAIQCA